MLHYQNDSMEKKDLTSFVHYDQLVFGFVVDLRVFHLFQILNYGSF